MSDLEVYRKKALALGLSPDLASALISARFEDITVERHGDTYTLYGPGFGRHEGVKAEDVHGVLQEMLDLRPYS